ncbi:MAG: peptidylprolyl isomerase [Ignavibacteriaceae bacterium]|nr:peptidylprolyl isomerase [Ignavibacteriaceae bacterium]
MPIKSNQVITISFILKDTDDNIIEATTKEEPFSFISGGNQILPKLEENIGEMLIGSKRTVVLSPEEAYGIYDDSALQHVTRSEFPEETDIQAGMAFIADSPDGQQMPFVIKTVEGENITIDFNHPLAGQTLTFDVELLSLRDATIEELSHGHVHGSGGHHH